MRERNAGARGAQVARGFRERGQSAHRVGRRTGLVVGMLEGADPFLCHLVYAVGCDLRREGVLGSRRGGRRSVLLRADENPPRSRGSGLPPDGAQTGERSEAEIIVVGEVRAPVVDHRPDELRSVHLAGEAQIGVIRPGLYKLMMIPKFPPPPPQTAQNRSLCRFSDCRRPRESCHPP